MRVLAIMTALTVAVVGASQIIGADAAGAGATSKDWKQVSAGGDHTCAITSAGRLFCWGADTSGQLGNDAPLSGQPTPVEVAGGATNWKRVSAGNQHTCALTTGRRLFCWGSDVSGRLGDDAAIANQPIPVEVFGMSANWRRFGAGGDHTCGRKTNGRLFCWGDDGFGQLGDDAMEVDQPTPVEVFDAHTDWQHVATGFNNMCATRGGRMFCWGRDGDGEVGNGLPNEDVPTPAEVMGGHTNWGPPTAGFDQACATRGNGRVFCWGDDSDGQLGNDAPFADQSAPVEVAGGATSWGKPSTGASHTCARRGAKKLFCWGDDGSGELGDDDPLADQGTPVKVAGTPKWRTVSAGGFHTCAIQRSGKLLCWGNDDAGELGDDATLADQPTPVEVAPHA